ncbi:MAG: hypothetical protein C4311_13270 [Chloroflexota bacterium]
MIGRRLPLISLTLMTLLGLLLRITHAGHLWLWGDEAWGLYLIRQGFWQLTLETALDQHPPLYHQLTYLWSLFAGRSELALRLFSIFAGVLSIPLTYQVGRQLSGRAVGLVGALLVALAPFSVHYSQEARMYSLIMALGLTSTYLLLHLIRSPARMPGIWAAYGLVTLLGLLTLYSYAFFVAFQGLILLLIGRARRRFPAWLGVQGAVALVLIPFIFVFIQPILETLRIQSQFGQARTLPALLGETWTGLAMGVTLAPSIAGPLALGLGVIAALGLLGASDKGFSAGEQSLFLAGALIIPLVLFYPLHVRLPWLQPRVFAFLTPALDLLLACGLVRLWHWRRASLVLALAYVGLAWSWGLHDYYVNFSRYDGYEDYRPLIAQVAAHAQPGDLVLHHARWQEGYFEAYYQGPPLRFEYVLDTRGRHSPAFKGLHLIPQPVALTPGDVTGLIRQQQPRQVWIMWRDIVRHPGGPLLEDQIEDAVSRLGVKVDEAWFGHVRLTRYALPPPGASPAQPMEAPWENGIQLQGYALAPPVQVIRPGEALYLTLYWRADGPTAVSYTVFTHLVGSRLNPRDGTPVWAGHDMTPGNGERPTTSWQPGEVIRDPHLLRLDPDAPPGEYILEVGLYDPASGQRLRLRQPDGSLGEDRLILARLVVP